MPVYVAASERTPSSVAQVHYVARSLTPAPAEGGAGFRRLCRWMRPRSGMQRRDYPRAYVRSLRTDCGKSPDRYCRLHCAQPLNRMRQDSKSVLSAASRVSTVASPIAGPLLNAPTRPPWSHPRKRGPCSTLRRALLGRIPKIGAPAPRSGAPSPGGRGERRAKPRCHSVSRYSIGAAQRGGRCAPTCFRTISSARAGLITCTPRSSRPSR
jgi:hypothetical protein